MALINLRNALMAGKRLPYDAEVEYLESTGTQYVDTGVTLTADTKIDITFKLTTLQTQFVFGVRASAYSEARFGLVNLTSNFRFDGITQASLNLNADTSATYRLVYNASSATIYNLSSGASTSANVSVREYNDTIVLFAIKTSGVIGSYLKGAILACKIWHGDNLVQDLIPVRVGTVGYLYDRVSGKLFGNAGSGAFGYGPDVVPVEWLESDGNQYIDTGVKPDATYTFDSTVAVMQSNYNCTYWGCRSSGSYLDFNNQCYLLSNTTGPSQSVYYYIRLISTNAGNNSNWNSGIIPETGRMYDFSGITTVSTMNAMTYPVVLFGLNIYGTISSSSGKVRIAKWTPYKSGVRVNDFRPVRVGTDATSWEGAMMDVLTRRIYRNAGTGAFTYGNDLKYPIPSE